MPRLFTGLQLPEETRFALSLKRGGLAGARWIEPEDYHITLSFIGDIDQGTAREVLATLDRHPPFAPFSLTVSHLGVFGGDKPRTLYAGLEVSEPLAHLQAQQERLLEHAGIVPEKRKFTPHVTLARLRDTRPAEIARHIALAGQFVPMHVTIDRFVLFSSRESTGGGPYGIEEIYPF